MQVNELRYSLLDKLMSVRDINVLQKINELIGNVDLNNPVFKVTDGQKQMLMKSEEDILNGDVISDDYNWRLWRTKEKVRSPSLVNGPNISESISEENSGKLNAKPEKNSSNKKRQSHVKINSDS